MRGDAQSIASGKLAGGSRLEEIDVLRGLAALTVAFSHYIPFWDRYLGEVTVIVPNAAGNYFYFVRLKLSQIDA